MPKSVKVLLLATAAVIGVTGQTAFGDALPDAFDVFTPFSQFNSARHQTGADGNIRLLWDYITAGTYNGSALWILNPQGQVIAAGDTNIPASVFSPGIGANGLPLNIAMHVQPSGNVTFVFAHVATPVAPPTPAVVDSFATWTYNAQGKLIASGGWYGPFTNVILGNLEFKRDTLIAHWVYAPSPLSFAPEVVWSLDEFGNIQTAAGPFGPFGGATVIGTDVSQVNGSPVQIWHWITVNGSKAGLNTWTVDATGNIIASASYGPF